MGIMDNIMLFSPAVSGTKFFPKNRVAELAEKYELRESRILLTVARLASDEKYKGYDKVIQALPDIIKEIPDIKYLVVGAGDDTVRVKALAKKLGLDKYVIFCGFIPNDVLVDYYSLCDVFIMPSKGEGFGIVFLEALACGKPVIAGNKDASREAILNGKLGILIDPDNTSEIAGAVIKVLKKDVPDRLLDSNYLRKESLEAYGIAKFMKRTDDFLRSLQSKTIKN